MPEPITGHVLLDKTGVGHAYIELFDDGRVKAGYWSGNAKTYESVDEAYARFRKSFDQSPNESAWNICQCLEDYMAQRDDGR